VAKPREQRSLYSRQLPDALGMGSISRRLADSVETCVWSAGAFAASALVLSTSFMSFCKSRMPNSGMREGSVNPTRFLVKVSMPTCRPWTGKELARFGPTHETEEKFRACHPDL
jgi:hypothetical protein